MAEDKKSIKNIVPESVDNAVKNMTNALTVSIGTTLADLWFLEAFRRWPSPLDARIFNMIMSADSMQKITDNEKIIFTEQYIA